MKTDKKRSIQIRIWAEIASRGTPGARSDIDTVWVVSGPIFENGEPFEVITSGGKTIGAPHSVFKVIRLDFVE